MNDWLWVIDPLDGTTNYSSGLPNFCVSIGVQHKGQTVTFVVYHHILERFLPPCAERSVPEQPLNRCGTKTDIHKAVVSTDFCRQGPHSRLQCRQPGACCPTSGMRVLAPLQYRHLLSPLAGYSEQPVRRSNLHEWDVCAALLIAEEAGAVHKFSAQTATCRSWWLPHDIMPSLEPLISEKPFDGVSKHSNM